MAEFIFELCFLHVVVRDRLKSVGVFFSLNLFPQNFRVFASFKEKKSKSYLTHLNICKYFWSKSGVGKLRRITGRN